jgi:osmotically inducible protein OsmC
MGTSKASATWEGTLKAGRGTMQPGSAAAIPFSFKTRFEGETGSNPEEMIGAALSGCFSMALSLGLEKAGHPPQRIETRAEVTLDLKGTPTITTITLHCQASVPGIDAAKFQEIAEETKKACPVSRALGGVDIQLQAKLAG